MWWLSRGVVLLGLMAGCGSLASKPSKQGLDRPTVENTASDGSVTASQGGFTARLTWHDGLIASERYLTAKVVFLSGSGSAATEVQDVTFIPTMPSMGHGTAMDEQSIAGAEKGVVTVENVYLIMGGTWDIAVTATVDGKRDTVHFKVEVP